MDSSPPGSSVHGTSQARILERVAIPTPGDRTWVSCISCIGRRILYNSATCEAHGAEVMSLSRVQLFATAQTVTYQVPLSMGFSRQEYWSGLPFPSPGDLPNPGIEPRSPVLQGAAAAKSLQLCPTLCDPTDGSPPVSTVPGILQARTLEWVAISFSNAWKLKVKVRLLSRVQLLVTPWTAAYQAPLFMGFPRQEYWSGVPLPSLHCRETLYHLSHHSGIKRDELLIHATTWLNLQRTSWGKNPVKVIYCMIPSI